MYNNILKFWFEEIDKKLWWSVNSDFDSMIKDRFLSTLHQAMQGELFAWRKDPKGRLAEIIVLDQFSRNIFRNTPQAFSQDPIALVLAQEAVALDVGKHLSETERNFLLLPFMHSESKNIHVIAEGLFQELASSGFYEFELKHKTIIDRFGRYPHRNSIVGRASSAEELEFLSQPGSSF